MLCANKTIYDVAKNLIWYFFTEENIFSTLKKLFQLLLVQEIFLKNS